MIIVSDTPPITALLTVGREELLQQLFGEVVIPTAVAEELSREHITLPEWLRVEAVRNPDEAVRLSQIVDPGEAEAIELAKELGADRLLIDERKGRRLAKQENVPVIGLLGVVLLARIKGLVPSARSLLQSLERDAGIYLAEELREDALRSVGE